MMKKTSWMSALMALGVLTMTSLAAASSHREAPAIADDPAAFAQACTRLFGNVQTRREIGHAARERARRENAPQVVRDRVLSICAGACRAP